MGKREGQGSNNAGTARGRRLAEALKANLKRRKAQQRKRAAASDDGDPRGDRDEGKKESG